MTDDSPFTQWYVGNWDPLFDRRYFDHHRLRR
jgi:hypothetical protein